MRTLMYTVVRPWRYTQDNPEVHTVLEMGYGRQELAAAVAAEGLRPLLPKRCPPGYAALMAACWEREPAARLSFVEVAAALERILQGELDAGWAGQQQIGKAGSLSAVSVLVAGRCCGCRRPCLQGQATLQPLHQSLSGLP